LDISKLLQLLARLIRSARLRSTYLAQWGCGPQRGAPVWRVSVRYRTYRLRHPIRPNVRYSPAPALTNTRRPEAASHDPALVVLKQKAAGVTDSNRLMSTEKFGAPAGFEPTTPWFVGNPLGVIDW